MPYVITFANQKGGVAKTTSTASLAGALAQQGYRVLVIDLDPQADLTLSFGIDPGQVKGTISDILANQTPVNEAALTSSIPGLMIIPANQDIESAEHFLPVRQDYETLLIEVLDDHFIREQIDVVLLDCPPLIGALTLNAINAADMLVVPTQPEYFSAHALRNMMAVIRHVRSRHNPRLIYRILITMQDRRNRIHRNLSEQIRTAFGDGLLHTVIEVDTKLRECSIAGVPINFYSTRSRGTLQYQILAEELAQYVQKAAVEKA